MIGVGGFQEFESEVRSHEAKKSGIVFRESQIENFIS